MSIKYFSGAIKMFAKIARNFRNSIALRKLETFLIPQPGEGIAEVEIVQWLVKPFDKIQEYQILCEARSDKGFIEYKSPFNGTITELFYKPSDMAQIGSPLFKIEIPDSPTSTSPDSNPKPPSLDNLKKSPPSLTKPQSTPPKSASIDLNHSHPESSLHHTNFFLQTEDPPTESNFLGPSKFLTSPAIRHKAKEQGIDLAKIAATGPGGRITKADFKTYLESPREPTPDPSQSVPESEDTSPPDTSSINTPSINTSSINTSSINTSSIDIEEVQHTEKPRDTYLENPKHIQPPPMPKVDVHLVDKVVKLTPVQKAMVKSMTEALKIPHLTYCEDIDVQQVIELRRQLKANLKDVKLTYMPFFIKALSLALLDYPIVNSVLNEAKNEYTMKGSHNVSIAMDTPQGLLVPNVKDVEAKSIYEIAKEMNRLQDLGQKGRLSDSDMKGGTISISNIGSIGGTYASPIIMPPQVFIGAFGTIRPRLEKVNGEIVEKQILTTGWSADHRLLDGATTARFVSRWKAIIENPSLMLLHLK